MKKYLKKESDYEVVSSDFKDNSSSGWKPLKNMVILFHAIQMTKIIMLLLHLQMTNHMVNYINTDISVISNNI